MHSIINIITKDLIYRQFLLFSVSEYYSMYSQHKPKIEQSNDQLNE